MATTFHAVTNDAYGILDGAMESSSTSFSLHSGEGALFPATMHYATVGEEILEIQSRSSDLFQVATSGRAVQGTTAAAHADGVTLYHNHTAYAMSEIHTAINAIENGTVSLAAITVSSGGGSIQLTDSVTSTLSDVLTLHHESTGTPVAGFGTAIGFVADSMSIGDVNLGRLGFVAVSSSGAEAYMTIRGRSGAADNALFARVYNGRMAFNSEGTIESGLDGGNRAMYMRAKGSGAVNINYAQGTGGFVGYSGSTTPIWTFDNSGDLTLTGWLIASLPSSNPGVLGRMWKSSGYVLISSG